MISAKRFINLHFQMPPQASMDGCFSTPRRLIQREYIGYNNYLFRPGKPGLNLSGFNNSGDFGAAGGQAGLRL
ncbi:MAG: hypothetical protein R3D35_06600 [Nitratireductor sp.]